MVHHTLKEAEKLKECWKWNIEKVKKDSSQVQNRE
jgi:hypothetical protein